MIYVPRHCDLLIIGGGITGAGIFFETTRLGLNVVLVERHDFAWGTSSRSSKLIHGGLRYLKEGQLRLTRDAVKERERLLHEVPGLVTPITFLVPIYKDHGPGRWTLEAGLSIYDLLAKKRQHRYLNPEEMIQLIPFIERKGLTGGYQFQDAQVDDARLVLRLIDQGRQCGGTALNYTTAETIHRDDHGTVIGAALQDVESKEAVRIDTLAIINATGCWAETLHPQNHHKQLRPLKGSHLIFTHDALPVQTAVSFMHPKDSRPLFAIPWEGVTLVGTTDLDYGNDLEMEPAISEEEADYMLEGVRALFPSMGLSLDQCISSLAGIRPVISSGNAKNPSEESREHDIWVDNGMVTVAGGKLTTYRRVALDAIKAAIPFLPPIDEAQLAPLQPSATDVLPPEGFTDTRAWQRLYGRYGQGAGTIIAQAAKRDLQPIDTTPILWAELPYAAAHESVRHLTDLLLRRVRLGLLLPDGGKTHMKRIKKLCRTKLGWSRQRWHQEEKAYFNHWEKAHGFAWRIKPKDRWQRLLESVSGLFEKIFTKSRVQ